MFAPVAPAQQACTIQLRVNVFGTTSPQSHWALGGGLNAGSWATSRAVARGCVGIDHITGVVVSSSHAKLTQTCSGAVCVWRIRSGSMRAIDFQAFGTDKAARRVHSNVVRVAWAGASLISGNYDAEVSTGGRSYPSQWTLTVSGGSITGTSHWGCCPGLRVDALRGTVSGNQVVITCDCAGQGYTGGTCTQTYTGKVVAPGRVEGTWSGTAAGSNATFTLTLHPP